MIAAEQAHILASKRMRSIECADQTFTWNFWERISRYAMSAQQVSTLAQILYAYAEVIEDTQ